MGRGKLPALLSPPMDFQAPTHKPLVALCRSRVRGTQSAFLGGQGGFLEREVTTACARDPGRPGATQEQPKTLPRKAVCVCVCVCGKCPLPCPALLPPECFPHGAEKAPGTPKKPRAPAAPKEAPSPLTCPGGGCDRGGWTPPRPCAGWPGCRSSAGWPSGLSPPEPPAT